MRIAVVGAGLSGLSLCYSLIKRGIQVTLFDRHGIGGGASGVAAGLLHPYVGQKGLRSQFAEEALEKSTHLLKLAEQHSSQEIAFWGGIYRLHWEDPPLEYKDIEVLHDVDVGFGIQAPLAYLITSGVTVLMDRYLLSLFHYLEKKGLDFDLKEITSLDPLEGFDHTIFALGGGLERFQLDLPIQFVKGQILSFRSSLRGVKSIIGKGHISLTKDPDVVQLGSTYEHHYLDKRPNIEVAKEYILPRIKTFFRGVDQGEILSSHAEIRVCRKGGYHPIIETLQDKVSLMTALGSRGLLYAPLYADQLVEKLAF